jgi:hypothetical protein
VAELVDLTARHPLRESLWVRLLIVLGRSGCPAEALARYETVRTRIVEELGVDPGPELQQVYADLLVGRSPPLVGDVGPSHTANQSPIPPFLSVPTWRSTSSGGSDDSVPANIDFTSVRLRPDDETAPEVTHEVPVPRQLPGDLSTFTGRDVELTWLLTAARLNADHVDNTGNAGNDGVRFAPAILAIDGMPGVGKTALAVHAAHRLAGRYADGQLFVDLHGFTQGVAPIDPASALEQMLRGLGVPGERIPPDLDARAALYRTRLADRRMLIVLDNAVDEAQVGPLLPGSAGCLVLLTSRRRLTGIDDVQPLPVDALPLDDALGLFARVTGEEPTSPTAVEIVELCGRLPLAIRIAAARLNSRPSWTAADLAGRLRDHRHRLSELDLGSRSVTAAVDLSYQQLTTAQRRMFRLLSLHPGADTDPYAAAALADTAVRDATRLLDDLTDAHLQQEPTPGRFRFHDLLRAHAACVNGRRHRGGPAGRADPPARPLHPHRIGRRGHRPPPPGHLPAPYPPTGHRRPGVRRPGRTDRPTARRRTGGQTGLRGGVAGGGTGQPASRLLVRSRPRLADPHAAPVGHAAQVPACPRPLHRSHGSGHPRPGQRPRPRPRAG